MISPIQRRFVIAICDQPEGEGRRTGTAAAIKAGYKPSSAHSQATRLLKNEEIQEAIKERQAELADMAELNPAWVLKQWKRIADADPGELMTIARTCCRHCYGLDYRYQWTLPEYQQALMDALQMDRKPPDPQGGVGFDQTLDPNPECPQCNGEGEERVRIADSRTLSVSARHLYAGVRKTKDGIRVNLRNQDEAVKMIANYLGMLIDKKELSGPNGAPMGIQVSAEDLTDDQLASIALMVKP